MSGAQGDVSSPVGQIPSPIKPDSRSPDAPMLGLLEDAAHSLRSSEELGAKHAELNSSLWMILIDAQNLSHKSDAGGCIGSAITVGDRSVLDLASPWMPALLAAPFDPSWTRRPWLWRSFAELGLSGASAFQPASAAASLWPPALA